MYLVDKEKCVSIVRAALEINEVKELLNYLYISNRKRTYDHCIRVGLLAVQYSFNYESSNEQTFNLKWGECYRLELAVAAILHDVGKLGVSNEILNYPGSLTAQQYENHIKPHPKYSASLVQTISTKLGFTLVPLAVYGHHQWGESGKGYPNSNPRTLQQLEAGSDRLISTLYQQIICLADMCDAKMTRSDRPKGEMDSDIESWLSESFTGEEELIPIAVLAIGISSTVCS